MALSYGKSFFQGYPLPQTCLVCRKEGSEDLRREWGCDKPSEFPQLIIPCTQCSGGNDDCGVCQGSGQEAIYRCPNTFMDRGTAEMIMLHTSWPQAFPLTGGLYDQPAAYVSAMRLIDQAHAKMEMMAAKEAKSNG